MKLEDFEYQDLNCNESRDTFQIGQQIDRFIIKKYLGFKMRNYEYKPKKVHYWLCQCTCPDQTLFVAREDTILKGNVHSCGCFRQENTGALNRTHGLSKTKEYRRYRGMVNRCTNPNTRSYAHYGGRGISIDPEWQGTQGIINYVNYIRSHQLYNPDGTPIPFSVNRVDNDGNYAPDNVHATIDQSEQTNNQSTNHVIDWYGNRYTIAELARRFGIKTDYVRYRLSIGKSIHEALFAPPFKSRWEREELLAQSGGRFPEKAVVINPLYFTDYPDVSTNDPRLNYYTPEELHKFNQ